MENPKIFTRLPNSLSISLLKPTLLNECLTKEIHENGVIGRRILAQFVEESGHSERTLGRYFEDYLSKPPVLSIYPSQKVNLIIDGTYFKNGICLVLYRDNTIKFTQLYRLTNGEHYTEIKGDLLNLLT